MASSARVCPCDHCALMHSERSGGITVAEQLVDSWGVGWDEPSHVRSDLVMLTLYGIDDPGITTIGDATMRVRRSGYGVVCDVCKGWVGSVYIGYDGLALCMSDAADWGLVDVQP